MQLFDYQWANVLAEGWQQLSAVKILWGGKPVGLEQLIASVLTGLLAMWVVWRIGRHFERRVLAWAPSGDLSLKKMIGNTFRPVVAVVAVLLALSIMGVDLTALAVVSGAIGVGIGLGLQKLAANYISGFVILAERSIRIGDWVRVAGFEGQVTDIRARCTTLRSLTGVEAVIPNETLTVERVENLSLSDRLLWLSIQVTLAPGTDAERAAAVLEAAALSQARVLHDPAPAAALSELSLDGPVFTLGFWIADPENGQLSVRASINRAVMQGLEAAGLSLATPRRLWREGSDV
jgi:small-conductance mechanosensitive channel